VPHDKSKKARIAHDSNDDHGAKRTRTLPANGSSPLELATEEELIAELAKRKAAKFKRSGAMKQSSSNKKGAGEHMLPEDGTGQMCSLTGGEGMIPCSELME